MPGDANVGATAIAHFGKQTVLNWIPPRGEARSWLSAFVTGSVYEYFSDVSLYANVVLKLLYS